MPEIDTDTFQVLALALSAAAFIVSLVVLSVVSKVRRELADAARPAARSTGDGETYAPASTREPEPHFQATRAEEPAAAQPVASATAGAQTQQAETTQGGPAAREADLPQEQPFERDGRWWYKRGDELLVYDEGSGQWEPAPVGSLAGGAQAAPTAQTAYTSVAEAVPASTEPSGSGEGWKCPSCGAVNGATAVSCRMCFTAKP